MKTAARNKLYPTAEPAFAAFERAVEILKDAEAAYGEQSTATQIARARVTAANEAYNRAVLADEKAARLKVSGP